MKKKIFSIVLIIILATLSGFWFSFRNTDSFTVPEKSQDQFADVVLTNAKVFTANPKMPWADTVAIGQDRFLFVGKMDEAKKWIGPSTVVKDLDEKIVLPGLIDSHTHPGLVSIFAQINPITDSSTEGVLKWLKEFSEDNPDIPYIVGAFWHRDEFGLKGPHKRDLDAIVNDKPVILFEEIGHATWLNSNALKAFGIDGNTKDPSPVSYYQRDENGELTGYVTEFALGKHLPKVIGTGEHFEEMMVFFLNYLASHGVTTLYDAGNISYEDEVYSLLSRLDKEGRLPLRIEGTYHIYVPDQMDSAVSEFWRLREKYSGENLKFNVIKIHFDGITEIRTAAMLEPYNNDPTNRGGIIISRDRLAQFIKELHREKIDLHLHTIGDRATRVALDAYEIAQNQTEGELYPRMTLCHLEVVDDQDIPRFKQLGVIPNFTPHWHGYPLAGSLERLGERDKVKFRAQQFFKDGVKATFSSDVISPAQYNRSHPFFGMQTGHNRQEIDHGKDSEIMVPLDERLSLEDLVMGYTANGAYQLRLDNKLGSIETGKNADLIVLKDNLFEIDRYDIHKARVSLTIMNGKIVHERTIKTVLEELYLDLFY